MFMLTENAALLFAVAAPVLTLVAMNLALALGGERGTLLLPGLGPLEVTRRAANALPSASAPAGREAPANDPDFRRAA